MNIVFHVGLHKTATTWLQSVFFTLHQEILLINDYKEPWNDEIIRYVVLRDRYSFDAEIYRKMIQARIESEFLDKEGVYLVSAERLSGHPCSGGFDREQIITNIYAAFPEAKILITFRNQVDLIRSTYQQMIREGDTQKQNIFLHRENWKRPAFGLKYYDLEGIYTLYNEFYDQKHLGFFCCEDLEEDKDQFIQGLCGFLKVKPFFPSSSKRVNAGIKGVELEATRIMNNFRGSEFVPSPVIDLGNSVLRRGLIRFLMVLLFFRSTDTLSSDDILMIEEYYSDANARFLSRIGSERLKDSRYVKRNEIL